MNEENEPKRNVTGVEWPNAQSSRVAVKDDEAAVIRRAQNAVKEMVQASLFEKYIDEIGPALVIIRKRAQKAAGSERTDTPAYRRHFGRLLHENGLDKVDKGTRSHLLRCMDHPNEIQEWRTKLPAEERERLNHPKNVWVAWKIATGPTPLRCVPKRETLRDAVLRLIEENDQLKRSINCGNIFDFNAPAEDQARILFAANNGTTCQQVIEALARLLKDQDIGDASTKIRIS